MKAIRLARTGGPEVLEYVEMPTPAPGPNGVLVKTHTIGVNMPEVLVRRGTYDWMPPLPTIPGIEMSGTVEAIGAAVTTFRPGDRVYVSARELPHRCGCYAEYICVPEDALFALPAGADLEIAATLGSYQVAWHLLNSATRGFTYESVLITSAAGAIGTACVQLARAAGKRVYAVASTAEKTAFARQNGADFAIAYKDIDWEATLADAVNAKGIDLILDAVAGVAFSRLFRLAAPLGLVVQYGHMTGEVDGEAVYGAMRKRLTDSLALRLFSMHTFDNDPRARRRCTEALLDLLARGAIRPSIRERLPLSEAARAHRLLESGEVLGKLVLKP